MSLIATRGKLPRVVADGDPSYVSLYEKAWELAYERTRQPSASEPWYRTWLDEAHSSQVYLWDLAAMMWFAKYMNGAFDPMGSMEIFYQGQRDDGAIPRRFVESDGRTDSNDGAVNPPLFAWSEWQWYQVTGDIERIRRVLPALREYLDYSSIVRWAQDSAHRLYWNDGGGSGLDWLKRPYLRNNDGSKQWGDPDMSAQTAQAYLLLGDMYEVVGDSDEAARMRAIGDAIGERINRFLWNDFTDGGVDYGQWFYADSAGNIAPTAGQYVDEPQGPGLWYSLIGATPAQTTRLRNIMSSEDWYFTDMPFGTLPKSHSQFQGWGGHSQGSVYPPILYMGIKGAENIAGYEFAQGLLKRYLDGMVEVFDYSDTVWEFYAPDKHSHTELLAVRFQTPRVLGFHRNPVRAPCTTHETDVYSCEVVKVGHTLAPGMYVTPARNITVPRNSHLQQFGPSTVAPDFVGWAGLGPIALLIENIIGIQAEVPNRRIEWHLTRTDRHGINSLWLGEMGKVDLIASSRSARNDAVTITVSTSDDEIADSSFELVVNRPECGKVTTLQVLLGQANQSFSVSGCAAGLVISDSAFTVTEGDATGQSYTVALATRPSAAVTVAISGQAGTDLVLDKANLTFSTTNWSSPQTVRVTATDDADGLIDPAVILTHRASGGDYGSVSKDLTVTIDEDDSYWLRDLALGQVTSVTGTVASGEGFMAVDGSADTAVALSGSWTLAVDLVDVYELATVQVAPLAGVQLGGFVVEGRTPGSGSGTWEELGRITAAGGGSVTVSSSQVRDMVRISPVTAPSAGTSDSVAVLEVFGYELRQGHSLTMDFSGSLGDAGLTQRGSSFSIASGNLVSGAGSSSFVVADLCGGCDLDHEAVRQATVTMLVEFPAVNPAGSNIGVSLGVGFEESQGRQRGVLAELGPWRPVSGEEGPLTMSLYCGGGGSGGPGRLRGWGVNLACSGSSVEKDFVDNTGQDLTDAFDPDVTLPGGRVWVELEYRNLKLWVRVWPEGEERPVLPRSGLRFGAEHFGGSSFNRDRNWLLNPGRLSLRAWGFSNSGQVKIESIVVSDVLLGPKLGTERGTADHAGSTSNKLTHIGRYYPMGKAVVDKPVYVTDRDAGKLPRVVADGDPSYVSLYEKAWELAYERTRQPSASEPWYRTWLDEAHSSQVYLWDLAAMMWFAKYMNGAFDPMGSMEIFYQGQRDDGAIPRRFVESDGRTDSNDGAVNPPLFAWSEWQWYQVTGDIERIRRVLPALREYLDYSSIVRWAQDSAHRLYWNDGGGSGLDWLKRPYLRNNDGSKQWGDPDMSAQTAQAYLLLGDMYEVVGDSDEAARMRAIGDAIGERINRFLWNDFTDGGVDYGQWFYADSAGNIAPTAGQYVDEPQGPGLWYSLIGATPAQTTRLRNIMSSEDWYFTDMPFGTLPKSHSQFQGWGGHSQGSVYPPILYMGIKGAENVGGYEFAQGLLKRYLDGMVEVFDYSDTVWEFYAPDQHSHTELLAVRFQTPRVLDFHRSSGRAPCTTHETDVYSCEVVKTGHTLAPGTYVTPARNITIPNNPHLLPFGPSTVAPDFVGWAGLGPIALLIENIIGIQAEVPNRRIEWHLTRTDRHGINSLWLGKMGKVDLIASSRSARNDAVTITVSTSDDEIADSSFELVVNRPECGKVTTLQVLLGQANQSFSVPACAGLVISQSALTVTEGNATGQSYTVALATRPSAAVTVTISGHTGSDLGLDKDSLSFSTSNWSSPQTVTVTARDDADALTDPVVTLTHSAGGGDYGAVAKDLTVTIDEDDDTAGLVISQSALTVTEGDGTGQSYTVALETQPSAAVTVTISGHTGSDLGLDKDSLSFSTSNWSSPQTVTVTARDDADALTDPVVTLTHSAGGGDYGAVAKDLTVTIDEDDAPGLVISQTALTVTEGDGTGQSYTVALETQPSAAVTVTISGHTGSDLGLDKDSLSFSTSNWSSPQTVTVTARDDADALTDPVVTLTHSAGGGDYGAVAKDLTVTIDEDDTAGLVISQSALTVTEGDGTGQSYTVALETQPSAAVTVTISGHTGSDLGLDKDSLSFSTSNWSSPQTVTVTARDDADALTDPVVTLTHSAGGGDYGAVAKDLTVTIDEDDTAGLVISQAALTVTEGDGTGQSYTVALTTQPSAAVTVTISGHTGSDLGLDKDSLSFSTSNWSSPQTVTVTARDDADALTDPAVTLTHAAGGGDYGAVAKDLTVTIDEDDAPGLVISQSALTVTEGDGTGQSYTVALETQPSAAVTVTISGHTGSDLGLDKDSLSFSTSNWSSPQTVTVTARDDADALTDPAVTLTHAAGGGDYGAVSKDLTVTIDEDDAPGLVISQSALTVTEGDGTGQSYTVALTTQPSAAVTVTISGQASTDLVLDKDSLSFSTSNWSSPQTVTVTARDDADALTDPAVTLTHSAGGGDYGAVSKDLTVTIDEDDAPGLVISQSALTVTEGDGTGQSYTVALETQPSAAVTVTISGHTGSDLGLDKDSLSFSTSNWSSPQTVTVTARDDADALTDPAVTLTHAAGGGDYGAVSKDLTVTIDEDDTAGLVISQSALTVTEGDGTGQSYTVALETQPSAAVTVTISGHTGSDLGLDKDSLSFSTSNWSSPQTVTVTARDDADALTDPAVTLTHSAGGGDYGAVSKDLTVTIDEDDAPGLVISQSALTVTEGDGTGQSYTVALETQPSAAVTVTISGHTGSDLGLDKDSLSFSTSNWSSPQTVTVTARDDADALTDPAVTLTHAAGGGDYGAVTGDLTVTIDEDDARRAGHLPVRPDGDRGRRNRAELHRGAGDPALGGGDGNDQRTYGQRPGPGQGQPEL